VLVRRVSVKIVTTVTSVQELALFLQVKVSLAPNLTLVTLTCQWGHQIMLLVPQRVKSVLLVQLLPNSVPQEPTLPRQLLFQLIRALVAPLIDTVQSMVLILTPLTITFALTVISV
jgi:hypothetical protein